jgi:hypothetical protein
LIKVVERTEGGAELLGRVRRSKASLSPWREFGGLDEVLGLLDGAQQWDENLG